MNGRDRLGFLSPSVAVLVMAMLLMASLLATRGSESPVVERIDDPQDISLEERHPDLGTLPNSELFVGGGSDYAVLVWWESLGEGRIQGEMRLTEEIGLDDPRQDLQPQQIQFASYTFYFDGTREANNVTLDLRTEMPDVPDGIWTGELVSEPGDATRGPVLRLSDPGGGRTLLYPAATEQDYADTVARLVRKVTNSEGS